jgi:parallel beta-helix repeat protein
MLFVLLSMSIVVGHSISSSSTAQSSFLTLNPTCGATITVSTTLSADVGSSHSPCKSNGLIIGTSSITLNCNHHTIYGGKSSYTYGILLSSESHVVVENCNVSGFGTGISLKSSNYNSILSNDVKGGVLDDINLYSSSNNNIQKNVAQGAHTYDGIHLSYGSNNNKLTSNSESYNHDHGIDLYSNCAGNLVSVNVAQHNGLNGFNVDSTSKGNTFKTDKAISNGSFGFYDSSTGAGTKGTANNYSTNSCSKNKLGPSHPAGLC